MSHTYQEEQAWHTDIRILRDLYVIENRRRCLYRVAEHASKWSGTRFVTQFTVKYGKYFLKIRQPNTGTHTATVQKVLAMLLVAAQHQPTTRSRHIRREECRQSRYAMAYCHMLAGR